MMPSLPLLMLKQFASQQFPCQERENKSQPPAAAKSHKAFRCCQHALYVILPDPGYNVSTERV